MSVTEAQRHHLYESLKTHLGPAEAETFMNMMPPTDWSQFATKSDLAELKAELKADFADLRGEFAELKGEFAELKGEFAHLRGDMADLKGDLLRTLGTWLFASQAGVIAAVALLVGFLGRS